MIRFLCFGVGLDPRQQQVFGPRLGPLLVGCVVGLISFSSIGLGAGFPGAGLNPARCFSTSVARNDYTCELKLLGCMCLVLTRLDQWIWWAGPLTASFFFTAVYYIAPPYHQQIQAERQHSHEIDVMSKEL